MGSSFPLLASSYRSLPAGSEPHASAREDMLLLVDFKWLMSGLGFWVDMGRWRADPDYADACIARGCDSRHQPLQQCARQLQARGLTRS
jgi:hypothetical protein